jgi:hypothetical protein
VPGSAFVEEPDCTEPISTTLGRLVVEGVGGALARILILGNCQAQLIEAMFLQFSPGIELQRFPPVFEMTWLDEGPVARAMASADVVFAQRTAPDFPLPWLTPAGLRAALGERAVIWPNIYFDGYFPRTQYIYRAGGRKLLSPLEDYHLAPFVDAYRRGISPREAARSLFDLPDNDPFEASYAELERRERESDLRISDMLRWMTIRSRAFYTPNHPTNAVLAELAARMAAHAGLPFDRGSAAAFALRLNRIYIAAFPGIVRHMHLPFDQVTVFRGRDVLTADAQGVHLGEARSFLVEELAEAFWKIYEATRFR